MIANEPLVSFILITYNHQLFIKNAVEAALEQDYDNIEIIISDDCSQDNTFSIISDCIKKYTGSKKVILNRNEKNLGLASNFNKAISIASGSFLVMASGDDISHHERSRRLISEWKASDYKKYILFHSKLRFIDKDGDFEGEEFESRYSKSLSGPYEIMKTGGYALGATLAWPKTLYDFYGPINTGILNEDTAMTFRASMKDGIILVNECLVDYRVGFGIGWPPKKNLPKEEKYYLKKKQAEYSLALIEQHIDDFKRAEYNSWQIERLLMKKYRQSRAVFNGYNTPFFHNLKHLLGYLFSGVSVKILAFILLMSLFKELGFKVMPQRLLR